MILPSQYQVTKRFMMFDDVQELSDDDEWQLEDEQGMVVLSQL
jgi:hypothetical protein